MAPASLTTAAVAIGSQEKRESRVMFILRRERERDRVGAVSFEERESSRKGVPPPLQLRVAAVFGRGFTSAVEEEDSFDGLCYCHLNPQKERKTLNENDPSLKRESTIEALSSSLDSPKTAPLLPRFTVVALLGFRTAALFPRSFATAAAECGCQSRCSASLSPMNCNKFRLAVF
ncbi:hypothetical protein PIB30_098725 [Stylosanthes scabra]|uniref:Uncharacterized protein n=1 Tax=Stylosanthes scabra TaxID=79078 RepID=A0ABU6XZ21_9FABA|nr:hypothetical protein [Stylosanthes scabra]